MELAAWARNSILFRSQHTIPHNTDHEAGITGCLETTIFDGLYLSRFLLFFVHWIWGAGDLNSDRKRPRLTVCQVSVAPRRKQNIIVL